MRDGAGSDRANRASSDYRAAGDVGPVVAFRPRLQRVSRHEGGRVGRRIRRGRYIQRRAPNRLIQARFEWPIEGVRQPFMRFRAPWGEAGEGRANSPKASNGIQTDYSEGAAS